MFQLSRHRKTRFALKVPGARYVVLAAERPENLGDGRVQLQLESKEASRVRPATQHTCTSPHTARACAQMTDFFEGTGAFGTPGAMRVWAQYAEHGNGGTFDPTVGNVGALTEVTTAAVLREAVLCTRVE